MGKKCSQCKTSKKHSDFHKARKNPDGHSDICKECALENYKVKKSSYKNNILARSVRMSMYKKLLKEQDGCCAICGKRYEFGDRRFAVDHDHNTGEVRGVLCNPCNGGLGMFKDDPDILTAAIVYLKQ